jgi:cytochrome c-type biogenesis protein CcmE
LASPPEEGTLMAPKRTTLLGIGALLVAGAALAFIAFGDLGKNLVYYWTPAEMLAAGSKAYGATIRLGGIVQKGTVAWDAGHTELSFRVANDVTPGAASVLVKVRETPPQMFREGIGVVVEGTFDKGQVFTSSRLMVNHSNEYRPPKPGEGDRWKDTLSSDTTSSARPK